MRLRLDLTALHRVLAITVVVLVVTALVEYLLGRPPICVCGYVTLWHGQVFSSENSQHLTDWYSFTHVLHGFAFYYMGYLGHLGYLGRPWRRLSAGAVLQAFVLALLVESAWEIAENTPFVISRYREATLALGYVGDSVVNSLSDILAMCLGFWLASRLPGRVIAFSALLIEIALAVLIRDNLTLNILMLLYPLPAIKAWQLGA